jgi:uncharacterized protein (DUF1778 family)
MPALHSQAVRQKRESKPSATARIEARVSTEQKRFFEKAAEVEGVTLTDFAVSSMQRAATQALQEHNMIVLSVRDQDRFVELLMNPPQPNEALRNAAKRYARSPEHSIK